MRRRRPEPAAAPRHHSDDPFESAQGMGTPEAGRHHEDRAPPLLVVGKLVGQDAGERLRGHSGPRQNPRALQERRRRDHDHGVALRGEPDLEQERDVEHDHALAPRRGAAEECSLNPANARMDDRLQPAQRRAVPEHALTQHCAVHRPVPDHAGKDPGDFADRAAAPGQQSVHRGIGIVHRHAEMAEHPGGGRLAHPDGARQPDNHHDRQPGRSAATWLRSASSTTGSAPYQPAKPGRAWCSNISRPSTARQPRARAAASNGVSSGV